jgi:ribonuclease Z
MEIFSLFDCGEGTQVSLRKLNLRWKKISTIFISHTHADHVTGLPGIMMLSSQVDRNEPLTIIGPPKIKEYVETARSVLDMYINYEVVVKEIHEEGEVYRGEGYSVFAFPLNHTKPCYGYTLVEDSRPGVFNPESATALGVPRGPLWSRLQHGETVENEDGLVVKPDQVMGEGRKGRKFSYVTDTAYMSGISDRVEGSDLFICESMFLDELKESAASKKHLTAKQAAIIAKDAGDINRMGLIHYSPRYTMKDLRKLVKEARTIFPDTFLTEDRQHIEIPYED